MAAQGASHQWRARGTAAPQWDTVTILQWNTVTIVGYPLHAACRMPKAARDGNKPRAAADHAPIRTAHRSPSAKLAASRAGKNTSVTVTRAASTRPTTPGLVRLCPARTASNERSASASAQTPALWPRRTGRSEAPAPDRVAFQSGGAWRSADKHVADLRAAGFDRSLWVADSTGQRNSLAEHLSRRLEAESLPRPLVQLSRQGVELGL